MDITGSILTATLPRQQTPTEASSVMPLLAALRSALTSREMSHLADAAVTTVSDPAANARSTPLPMNVGDLATGDGQIQREPIAMPYVLAAATGARLTAESHAEGAPVTHNHDKPIGLNAPERGDDGTARYLVVLSQLRHRGQSLLWLPFPLVDSCA